MEKLKQLLQSLKDKGLDLTFLMIRDVKTKEPSATFTFFVFSGIAALLALFDKTKLSLNLGLNYDNARDLLIVTGCLYLGRKVTSGSTTTETKQGE